LGANWQRIVERERKKAEKQAKFDQKKAKATAAVPTLSANKEKKAKAEIKAEKEALPKYVEDTPAGDKKSMWNLHLNPQLSFRFADRISSHQIV
jgi:valyl-tRNA synthetase